MEMIDLVRVDKRGSPVRSAVIQVHLCMGDEPGTQPDV